jgi:hypothetical protein
MRNIVLFLLLFSLLDTRTVHAAQNQLQCFDSNSTVEYIVKEIPKNILYTFYVGEKAQYYLAMTYNVTGTNESDNKNPWRLLERYGDDNWCLVGAGSNVEFLVSLHKAPEPKSKYGLPGSGFKRCNDTSDGLLGSESVRIWANKELGDSFIQHFPSELSNQSFTFLNSLIPTNGEVPWILITTKKEEDKSNYANWLWGGPSRSGANDVLTSCYQSRGSKLGLHQDYKASR